MKLGGFGSAWISAPLFAALLTSATPIVRLCPVGWDQVPLVVFLRCTGSTQPVDVSLGCGGSTQPKDVATSCPRSSMACEKGSACPLGASACARRDGAQARPHSDHSRGRAYCLSDPFLATGVRPRPPVLHAPGPERVAILSMASAIGAMGEARISGARPEPRAPTRRPDSRPPIRGPPAIG